jgi:hypothetical protein
MKNKTEYSPNIVKQHLMFNKVLSNSSLSKLEIKEFCLLVKSFIDSGINSSSFTFEDLLLFHKKQLKDG